MAGLRYVRIPKYSAVIFRRSYSDLIKAGALIDRAHEWLGPTDAVWDGKSHTYIFPSGAKLAFSYLDNDRDVYHHQSAEYQFVGFDELTQFSEFQYRYMHSRLRRLQSSVVPIQIRGATNPGGIGHVWVKRYFLQEGVFNDRAFIPAKLDDNPYLDRKSYIESLNHLDPVTRERYLNGDWDVTEKGMFGRDWWQYVNDAPVGGPLVRFWDLASTEKTEKNEPDWTSGCLMTLLNGVFYLLDIRRTRSTPQDVENLIKNTALEDSLLAQQSSSAYSVVMEMEGGSSGKGVVDHYAREVLVGYDFRGIRNTGSKSVRATPMASACQAGNLRLVVKRTTPWLGDFLDEISVFPFGLHDDQVDSASGAFNYLSERAVKDLDVCFGKVKL